MMLNSATGDISTLKPFQLFLSVTLHLCQRVDCCVMAVLLCIFYWRTYSQPPASPSTQEAIQGMLSMANLSSSDSLQQPWSNSQSKNNSQSKSNSHSAQAGKKAGAGGNDGKRPSKRLPKKPRKSSSIESLDYDDDQDHMDACFKDSDYGEDSSPLSLFYLQLSEVRPVLRGYFLSKWVSKELSARPDSLLLTGAVKNRLTPDGSTCRSLILNWAWNVSLGVDDRVFVYFSSVLSKSALSCCSNLWFFFLLWNVFFVKPIQAQLFGPSRLVNKPLTQVWKCYFACFLNF